MELYISLAVMLFPAPPSASSFPYHGKTYDLESLEPAACDVEKGDSAYFP